MCFVNHLQLWQHVEKYLRAGGVSCLGSAYNIRIRHGEYSVQFATLRFYPTSSFCIKSTIIAWFHCACVNIHYNHPRGRKPKVIDMNTVTYRLVALITPKLCIDLQDKRSIKSSYEKLWRFDTVHLEYTIGLQRMPLRRIMFLWLCNLRWRYTAYQIVLSYFIKRIRMLLIGKYQPRTTLKW